MTSTQIQNPLKLESVPASKTAFGCPRDFGNCRFVYTVISSRAGGLSVGVDMNPDKYCNFDCAYCEVNRLEPAQAATLDVPIMVRELEETLELVHRGALRERAAYRGLADDLLKLRQVALSGDGEPTLCPNFVEAVEAIIHVRMLSHFPFFKIVLITNASGLNLPAVQEGIRLFTRRDEIWAKLDAGTQEHMNRVNRPGCALEKIVANILTVARQRPVVIQSLFPSLGGVEPSIPEIQAYVECLNKLKNDGAQISRVQIYSATRPTPHSECGHLALSSLSRIARQVRSITGLKAEVF